MKNLKQMIPWRRKSEALSRPPDPFGGLETLHRQINDMFNAVFEGGNDWALPVLSAGQGSGPRFDVAETDKAVEVTAELPGMDEKDIQVTLDGQMLCVCGEKNAERDERKKNYHLSELSYGRFERTIALPAEVDQAKAKALFKKGVLRLNLKTAAEKTPRTNRLPLRRIKCYIVPFAAWDAVAQGRVPEFWRSRQTPAPVLSFRIRSGVLFDAQRRAEILHEGTVTWRTATKI